MNQGHSTLSHTNTHPDLTTLTLQNKYNELARTTSAFKNSGVCKRPTLFRPPFGSTGTEVEELAGRMGLRGVLWTVDTLDWKLAVGSPTKMLADFKTNLANTGTAGVIQLSHDLIAATVNQVPKVSCHAVAFKLSRVPGPGRDSAAHSLQPARLSATPRLYNGCLRV